MVSDSVERERTWLVARLPDPLPAGIPLVQGYLPGDGEVAMRIRRAGGRNVATVKGVGTRSRIELEWDLTRDQFDALWPMTACRRVEKVRHEVPLGGLTAEVDVFGGVLEGLVLVEVEFGSDDEVEAFRPPGWFGDEVTDDPRYRSAALACDGLPEPCDADGPAAD